MVGIEGWYGRNCVTERRRCWEMWRMRQDGGGISWYDKEVVYGVATVDDML
jgi:hypothetical protein